jgi:hypothetical protein
VGRQAVQAAVDELAPMVRDLIAAELTLHRAQIALDGRHRIWGRAQAELLNYLGWRLGAYLPGLPFPARAAQRVPLVEQEGSEP